MSNRQLKWFILILALVLIQSNISSAAVLWDTGPASGNMWGRPGVYPFGFTLQGGQYAQYASGRLDVTQRTTLTKVEGWMATDGSYYDGDSWVSMNLTGGYLTIGIYETDDITWLPTTLLQRTSAFLLADGSNPNWYGKDSLNITLNPGYYYVSFEPVDNTFTGSMSTLHWINDLGIYPPAWPPNPMPDYAYYYGDAWHRYGGSYNTVGMRIEGVASTAPVNAVPEPASMVLLATGLAGLFGLRTRKSG